MMIVPHVSFCIAVAASLAHGITLPSGPGPYGVTSRTTELNDFSRAEVFGPDGHHRRLMIEVYSPIPKGAENCESPYLPETVAAYASKFYASAPPPLNFSVDFTQFSQQICTTDVTNGPPRNKSTGDCLVSRYPLIFFGHGHTASRFFYSVIVQFLASYGFIVVNIDHPYDALVVEFPDGSTIFYSPETDGATNGTEKNLAERTADVSFILDQLSSNTTLRELVLPQGVQPTSFDNVGIWGHSLGGATAISALRTDKRFKGGINVDGSLHGPVQYTGVDRPVVFWQDDNRATDQTWLTAWPKMRSFKQVLKLKGSIHNGMMDGRLLADLAGVDAPVLGSIDGLVLINSLVDYARDFFHFVLKGKGLGLLAGPSQANPQVEFVDFGL